MGAQRQKKLRPYVLVGLGFMLMITTGIWVNLFTSALEETTSWLAAVRDLGWNNVWLGGSLLFVSAQIGLSVLWTRLDSHSQRARVVDLTELENGLVRGILELAVSGIRALRPDAKVNARYFVAEKAGSQTILRRRDAIHVETDPMPHEYGLDYAVVGADNLVICDSFLTRSPIYDDLEENHLNRYGPRIKHLIDPRQRWVLACPVFPDGSSSSEPYGIICFYSTHTVVGSQSDEQQLKQVAVVAAETVSHLLQVRSVVGQGI